VKTNGVHCGEVLGVAASAHLGNAEYLATMNTDRLRAQRLLVDSERMSQLEQDVGGLKRSVAGLEEDVAGLRRSMAEI
jgi:hypothetical protein